MKLLGRIIARGEIAGLFIPLNNDLDGIYEVHECLGELTIRKIGTPAMPRKRFTGLNLEGLHGEIDTAITTKEELAALTPTPE
jgi:hypothetical protein